MGVVERQQQLGQPQLELLLGEGLLLLGLAEKRCQIAVLCVKRPKKGGGRLWLRPPREPRRLLRLHSPLHERAASRPTWQYP